MGHKEVPVTQLRKKVLEELERRNYSHATAHAGIVAKTRERGIDGTRRKWPTSDRQPKQRVDKLQLREWVTFAHPSGSPLPNHVDRLDSL